MFPVDAIVLKKTRIDGQRIVLTCFSSEFGKIDMFYRESLREARLDVLSRFTGQVRTKDKNTLTQIYRCTPIFPPNTYEVAEMLGWSASILYHILPAGLPYT